MIEVFHTIFFILCVVGCTASTFYYIFVTKKRLDRKKLETERTDEEDGEEIITDENVINVFDSTIGMVPSARYYPNRDYFIPLREKTDKLSPKKKMKAHTLEEPIGYSGENVMGEERAREWEEGLRERRRREQRMMVKRWGVLGNLERRGGVWKLR